MEVFYYSKKTRNIKWIQVFYYSTSLWMRSFHNTWIVDATLSYVSIVSGYSRTRGDEPSCPEVNWRHWSMSYWGQHGGRWCQQVQSVIHSGDSLCYKRQYICSVLWADLWLFVPLLFVYFQIIFCVLCLDLISFWQITLFFFQCILYVIIHKMAGVQSPAMGN